MRRRERKARGGAKARVRPDEETCSWTSAVCLMCSATTRLYTCAVCHLTMNSATALMTPHNTEGRA